MEGKAAAAARYPEPLAGAMCQGLVDQKYYDIAGMVPTKLISKAELRSCIQSMNFAADENVDLSKSWPCRFVNHPSEIAHGANRLGSNRLIFATP